MPDSNQNNAELQERAVIQVPSPANGTEVSVPSEPGGSLKFSFDPATATASRPEGTNDLVFDVDGGGRVVIGGFFEVGDNTLPDLPLPDGTVVAAADFFEGSDLDMTTAAGPGAGAPASGGTNYDDDGGALLAGLDKYGMLGTDYWGRAADVTEIEEPLLDLGDAFVPVISIRPLPPGEWPELPNDPRFSVNADGDRLLLDEAYLKNGTKAEGQDTPVVGYLVYEITSNDGLASVTIAGAPCAVRPDGTVDVSGLPNFDAGDVSAATVMPGATPGTYYLVIEYTLDQAYGHTDGVANTPVPQDELVANLGVSASSVNGATSGTAAGTVEVRDDAPDAKDDVTTLAINARSIVGDVLTGKLNDGTETGDADKYGADQPSADTVAWTTFVFDGPDGEVTLVKGADGKLTNQDTSDKTDYGTLTVADGSGSYTYTRGADTPNGDLKAGYTIEDADGDTDAATLTITVKTPPTITFKEPDLENGEGVVYEGHLNTDEVKGSHAGGATHAGEDHDGHGIETSITFVVNTYGEDLTSFTIQPDSVITVTSSDGSLQTLADPIPTANGEITGWSYDAETDELVLHYTLTDRATHDDPTTTHNEADGSASDGVNISVTTGAGDSLKSENGSVTIMDDTPFANDDVATLANDANSIAGDVLTGKLSDGTGTGDADGYGADQPAADTVAWTTFVFDGPDGEVTLVKGADGKLTNQDASDTTDYGTLAVADGSGSYIYTRGADTPNGDLKAGYTIADSEGDTDAATLTITVKTPPTITFKEPDLENGEGIVYEGHLNTDEVKGSHAGGATHAGEDHDGHGVETSITFVVNTYGEDLTSFTIQPDSVITVTSSDGSLQTLAKPITTTNGEITGWSYDAETGELVLHYTLTDRAEHTRSDTTHNETDGSASDGVSISVTTDAGASLKSENGSVTIMDDTSIANSDWVTIAPGENLITGNVIVGEYTDSKGTRPAGTDPGDASASDEVGADGGGVYRVRVHSDDPGDHTGEEDGWHYFSNEVSDDGGRYILIAESDGTLKIYENGNYTFTPSTTIEREELGSSKVADFAGEQNSSGWKAEHNDFVYEVVRVSSNGRTVTHEPNKLEIDTTQGGLGVKGGDSDSSASNEIGGVKNSSDLEGVIVYPPAGEGANEVTVDIEGWGPGESIAWVVYDVFGNEIARDVTPYSPEHMEEFGSSLVFKYHEEGIGSVLVYPGNGSTAFRIGGISAAQVIESESIAEKCFDYELKDGDGDTSGAQLHFHPAAHLNMESDLTVAPEAVNEANLGSGTAPDNAALTQAGSFDIDNQNQDFSFTITNSSGSSSVTVSRADLLAGKFGQTVHEDDSKGFLKITGYDAATGKVTYEYTLSDRWENDLDKTNLGLDSTFAVELTDSSGLTSNGNLVITILDDAPIAESDTAWSNGFGKTVSGDVTINDEFGADGSGGLTHIWRGAHENPSESTGVTVNKDGSVTIDGDYGKLTIWSNGKYSYEQTQDVPKGSKLNDQFTYQIKDSEGDDDTAVLTINLYPRELIVGHNSDDGYDSGNEWLVGGESGRLVGNADADIIAGDEGGASFPPKNYNMVFVLDYSGSMGYKSGVYETRYVNGWPYRYELTREEVMEDALKTMLKDLSNYNGGRLTIALVAYASDHRDTKTITFDADDTPTERAASLAEFLKCLDTNAFNKGAYSTHDSGTNYEAGLEAAGNWLAQQGSDAENHTLFFSDGVPTQYTDADGTVKGNGDSFDQTALNEALANSQYQYLLQSSTVRAIAIGDGKEHLNKIDETKNALDATDMNDLKAIMLALNPLKFEEAGSDYIYGDAGDDIMFGDVLNTDKLAEAMGLKEPSMPNRAMDPGQGWDIFKLLESGDLLNPANALLSVLVVEGGQRGFWYGEGADRQFWSVDGWGRQETVEFINKYHADLGSESHWRGEMVPGRPETTEDAYRDGGDDIIVGGKGNDIIYGQEGDDVIVGGEWHYNGKDGEAAFNDLLADVKAANPGITQITGKHIGDYLENNMNKIGAGDASDGNNTLNGGTGDDLIIGGGGNDIIYGGAGDDIMFGGAGADTFVWTKGDLGRGTDMIMDFSYGEDKLSFEDIFNDGDTLNYLLATSTLALRTDAASEKLFLTLNQGGIDVQEIVLNLENSDALNYTAEQINTDLSVQAEILQQLIANLNG